MPINITRPNFSDGDILTANLFNNSVIKEISGAFPADASVPLSGPLTVVSGTVNNPALRFAGATPRGFYFNPSEDGNSGEITFVGSDIRTGKDIYAKNFHASNEVHVAASLMVGYDVHVGQDLRVTGYGKFTGQLETQGLLKGGSLNIAAGGAFGGGLNVSGNVMVYGQLNAEAISPSMVNKIFASGENYNNAKNAVRNMVYPIGSIYISVNSTNPSSLFGGMWEAFGTGRMLMGVDASDANLTPGQKTGGTKNYALQEGNLPSHTHAIGKIPLTAAEPAGSSHKHEYWDAWHAERYGTNSDIPALPSAVNKPNNVKIETVNTTARSYDSGSGASNISWQTLRETVGAGTTISVSGETNEATTKAESRTASPLPLPPYITVYMWKRTA
jgi:hypothetical protein